MFMAAGRTKQELSVKQRQIEETLKALLTIEDMYGILIYFRWVFKLREGLPPSTYIQSVCKIM